MDGKASRHEDTARGCWFRAQTDLADGRTLILSGADERGNTRIVHGERRVPLTCRVGQISTRALLWVRKSCSLSELVSGKPESKTTKSAPPEGEAYPHVWQSKEAHA